jgi:hypothetical protein
MSPPSLNNIDHVRNTKANEVARLGRTATIKHRYSRFNPPPKYIRPECSTCKQKFRGEHELNRHNKRHHASLKQLWICIDGSVTGARHSDSMEARIPLKDCKRCREKKRYGAYYNAASHLRSCHFFPRDRGPKSKGDNENRAMRKHGEDRPNMTFLKAFWLRAVMEDEDGNVVETSPEKTAAGTWDHNHVRGLPIIMGNPDLDGPEEDGKELEPAPEGFERLSDGSLVPVYIPRNTAFGDLEFPGFAEPLGGRDNTPTNSHFVYYC